MTGIEPTRDPYDLWATNFGLKVKEKYYNHKLSGKLNAVFLGLVDWLTPEISRKVIGSRPRIYPISVALEILRLSYQPTFSNNEAKKCLDLIRTVAVDPTGRAGWAWGLGLPWMSKNGMYGPKIPFITHTPYVMESLLELAKYAFMQNEAMELFYGTFDFLESLQIMYESSKELALSYAPVCEPRIVVNANAYAAYAYGLHAVYGKNDARLIASEKCIRLVRWVVSQQRRNGSWMYYADLEPGNFIDCFHSCFVIKNLVKVKSLIPESEKVINCSIEQGTAYIRKTFNDESHGLCRRFAQRDIKDPFKYDMYDQAEYLGLLVDLGLWEEANALKNRVESIFRKGNDWYCRIDILGRRWGKNFLRWGIVPFWYHCSRLERLLAIRG